MIYLLGWLILVNVIAFIMYGVDKNRAKKHQFRISESALFLIAIMGGGCGAYMGMRYFHHKTKHWYFRFGIPCITIVWVIIILRIVYEYI